MIKFNELANTCSNTINTFYVYVDLDQWEDMIPEDESDDLRTFSRDVLNAYVDQWEVDANFNLHALISL